MSKFASTFVRILFAMTVIFFVAGCGPQSTPAVDVLETPHLEAQQARESLNALITAEQGKLVANDGATGDEFGVSVSISGDTAIVGARTDSVLPGNFYEGSAYVFVRNGTTWTQQAKLVASDGVTGDEFGRSVAVSGDMAIVGAHGDDFGANANQGSAYVFARSGTTWTQQAKLVANDPGATDDRFGFALSLSGNTVLVGVPWDDDLGSESGSAYVFVYDGAAWTQQAKLIASDGAAGDWLGFSVSLWEDTAFVGAYYDDIGANTDQGSVYVFERSGTTWTEQAKLTASDGALGDKFGYSTALWGDTAFIGARTDDIGANNDQGSAYVFVRNGMTWTEQSKLVASDGAAGDLFGTFASMSGNTAIVTALADDVGANSNQGSAYVFARGSVTWTEQAKLLASDGAAGDLFGWSVSLVGDTAVVGALMDDNNVADSGSAYVFELHKTTGDACAQNAECLSYWCVDGVCCDNFCDGACVACNATKKG